MGKAVPAIPEFRARGHVQWHTGAAPIGVAFLGRTSTSTMQDPVVSLLRQYRGAGERLPDGFCITRCYWDIESGGIELDARSQDGLWRQFADAGIPRDGGMAELRADVASGHAPFSAAVQAVYDTLRALRDGVPPRELKNIASTELMRQVTRADDYQRWTKDYLGGA